MSQETAPTTATAKPKKALPELLQSLTDTLKRSAAFIFFLLLACVYGFVLLRINTLSNVPPSPAAETQVQAAAAPHIDPTVVNQLKNLKDNSVSVKALFDKARTNPFKE